MKSRETDSTKAIQWRRANRLNRFSKIHLLICVALLYECDKSSNGHHSSPDRKDKYFYYRTKTILDFKTHKELLIESTLLTRSFNLAWESLSKWQDQVFCVKLVWFLVPRMATQLDEMFLFYHKSHENPKPFIRIWKVIIKLKRKLLMSMGHVFWRLKDTFRGTFEKQISFQWVTRIKWH